MAAAFRSVTVITTLVTSTPTTIVPRQQLLEVVPDASNPSPPIVTTISPSLHLIHQSRQESNSDNDTDDDDGWKYAVRLYACGYRSGNFVEAIRPPPDQICVLDLRSGLYGFCKDPGEGTGGRLDLKRDCSGWRGGCVDAFGCKEAECGAVGSGKGRNRFSEVETCTGNNPYCVISELRFSTAAANDQVYRRFGCNAYPTTINYLVTPYTAPPLATITATGDGVGGWKGGKGNPSSVEKQQQQNASKTGSIIGGVIGGIALICFAVLMARSMDTKDRRGKKRQARAAAAQGKRGVNKAGSEAEAESDEERQQNNLAEEATGGEKRTCLGYNREISSLLPSARGALGTHKSSSFSQEQQRQEPTAGHSEENPQQQATKTRTTLITSNTFSLWAAKRQCPPPYQARAELPEDCCCTPATVSGWSQQQQREAGVAGLVCELPAEVPETPQAFDAAVSGRRRRRSSPLPSLNRRDGVVSVGGLEPKNGGRGGEGWKNDSKTLAQKGLIPHRYGKKENGQDLYDKQGDREHGSPCSSNESGPLGRLDVKEGGNMDAENWI